MKLSELLIPVASLITALTIIIIAVRKVGGFFRRMVHLFDEMLGTESRDGLPASPGLSARIGAIEAELRPNGGSSIRDSLNRLEVWTTSHSHLHDTLDARYHQPTN